jgi:NDP-sugar pyrophosphorylase family protein
VSGRSKLRLASSLREHRGAKLNVILPCAGKGTRLGLPYPKEMHLVAANTALIDLTFRHLDEHRGDIDSVTVVLAPEKGSLVSYLEKWSGHFHLRYVYFNDDYHEWAGSILSSAPEFTDKNVVFLPDSLLESRPEQPVVPAFRALLEEADAAFAYLPESRPEVLRNLGALRVQDGHVEAFCDKPDNGFDAYNAFWCAFGFRGPAGRPLLEAMTRSIQRRPIDVAELGQRVRAFAVDGYFDLGVWPNLHEYTARLHAQAASGSAS